MKTTTNKLEELLKLGSTYLTKASASEITYKANPEKWSKKELLGHLIDSGINNLQRFTEIQFEEKPYKVRKYHQNELVKANNYQHSEINELINFWLAINNRILMVIKNQTEITLSYTIEIEKGHTADLKFLIIDYVNHMEHHINQIITK